jgi:cohesin complex subunit SCC1
VAHVQAFRPGVVDLPEDQQRTSNNAITLADSRNDFDFFDWSWSSAMPPPPVARETAGPSRQHLNTQTREYGAYNFGRIAPGSIYGGSTPSRQSQDRDDVTSKLDSNDFSGIDLDIIDIPEPVEVARRETTPRSNRSSLVPRGGKSLEPDFPEDNVFGDTDLQLDDVPLPELTNRERRESMSPFVYMKVHRADDLASALSTPPPVSPPPTNDITPRTAAKIADMPAIRDRLSPAVPKAKKARLVQADSELELDESEFAMNRDNSDILAEERYIPADPEIVRLQQIMDDPAGHFLPNLKVGGENMFYAGPQDLAPELAGLFTFPTNILRKRQEEGAQDDRLAKRPRIDTQEPDNEQVDPVEFARRDSLAPSARENFDFPGGGEDSGFFAPDQPMDPEEIHDQVTPTGQRTRDPSLAPSRAESVVREFQFQQNTGDHMLSMFEKEVATESQAQSQSQVQQSPSKSMISEPMSKTSSGYSKNTGMAMGLLRRELEAIEEEDKVISLAKIADKVRPLFKVHCTLLMNRPRSEQHLPSSLNCSYWVQEILSSSTNLRRLAMWKSGQRINCLQRSLSRGNSCLVLDVDTK